MTFDKNATISKSYIEDTKEAELQKISIRPQYVNQNIVGKDMFLENYEVHNDVLNGKVELLEPTKGGIFRMKYETTAEFKQQSGWPAVYAYTPKTSRRPFLFKPLTKYTFTYYVHEITNPKSGFPDIICMAGDGYSHVSETLGLRTVTVTSTAQASNGGGLFHIMIAGPDTWFEEGERRCYDIVAYLRLIYSMYLSFNDNSVLKYANDYIVEYLQKADRLSGANDSYNNFLSICAIFFIKNSITTYITL